MTAILQDYGILGIVIGLFSFLVIGLFHPLVIKGEYYFGTRCWIAFLIAGIVSCVFSVIVKDVLGSALLAVTGFSCFWSIMEVFEQRQRVLKGWFPMNPKRKADYEKSQPAGGK